MKKLFCLSVILVIILTACAHKNITDTTTQTGTIVDRDTTVLSSEHNIYSDSNIETDVSKLSATEKETAIVTENQTTEIIQEKDSVQNSSPLIIYATFEDLKEIKYAFNTKEPDEFMEYMEKEKTEQYMTGFDGYENSKKLLEELSSTSLPLLDGNTENFYEISFYQEDSSINQIVKFDDEKRASTIIYTPNSSVTSELTFDDNTVIVSEKTIFVDDCEVKLYETENNYYQFFAETVSDGSYIVLRSINIECMEDFENCIKKLKFVKIGDLIENSEPTSEGITE